MLIKEHASHLLEVDRLSTDEGLALLLHNVVPTTNASNSNYNDGRYYHLLRLQQQALPIVERLGHSALLLNLANQYILKHPSVYENISRYLDYHEKISFAVLNNTQLGLQSSYRFKLAAIYETSLAAIRNISTESTAMLSLYAFLHSGMVQDRLIQEAAHSVAEKNKFHSTWLPFLLFLQTALCGAGPLCVMGIFVAYCPWTPRLEGRTRIVIEYFLTFLPVIFEVPHLFTLYIIEQSKVDKGDIIVPPHLLSPRTMLMLIYLGVGYALPVFSQWLLQEDKLPWRLSTLPKMFTTTVLLTWLFGSSYYAQDSTLEHHLKALLDNLDFSGINVAHVEKAIVSLQALSRRQIGIGFFMNLSWLIFWKTLIMSLVWFLRIAIMTIWTMICKTVLARLGRIQRRPWYLTILCWLIRLLSTPVGISLCYIIGWRISQSEVVF